jgi:hypothetical protein
MMSGGGRERRGKAQNDAQRGNAIDALPTLVSYPSFRFDQSSSPGETNLSVEADKHEESSSESPSAEYYATLKECLTEQPWHEIGQGPCPFGATNDHAVMVNQLTSLLGTRLKELLVNGSKYNFPVQTQLGMLTPDTTGDGKGYDLVPKLWDNLRAYVDRIALGYNTVYYHSVEHCTHVTISMNKLISMLVQQEEMSCSSAGRGADENDKNSDEPLTDTPMKYRRRRSTMNHIEQKEIPGDPPQSTGPPQPVPLASEENNPKSYTNTLIDQGSQTKKVYSGQRKSTSDLIDNTERLAKFLHNSNTKEDEGQRSLLDQVTFGIATEPFLRFAMLFSALVHDVEHKGVPNTTLVEEEDELAILHNDISVAEQNSLQVTFSTLNLPEFALLKSAIMPTKDIRKKFRKQVIDIVLVTDISNPDRMQINQSKWKEAFPVGSSGEGEGSNDSNSDGKNGENNVANQDAIDNGEAVAAVSIKEANEAIERRRHTMHTSRASDRQLQSARCVSQIWRALKDVSRRVRSFTMSNSWQKTVH